MEVEGWRPPESPEELPSRLSEAVDADAVRLGIDLVGEPGQELFQLSRAEHAFEHRLLHTLSVPLADVRDVSQSSSPFRRLSGYIVGYQDFHHSTYTETADNGRDLHASDEPGGVLERAVPARGGGVVE